jgi:Leucine-rich repeat (LRR) protein
MATQRNTRLFDIYNGCDPDLRERIRERILLKLQRIFPQHQLFRRVGDVSLITEDEFLVLLNSVRQNSTQSRRIQSSINFYITNPRTPTRVQQLIGNIWGSSIPEVISDEGTNQCIGLKFDRMGKDAIIEHFIPNIERFRDLRYLTISEMSIDDDDITRIASHFKDIPQLIFLDLSINNITRKGGRVISQNLGGIPNLEHLDLSYNRIGNSICSNLGRLTRIKYLNLRSTMDMKDDRMFSTILPQLKTLEVLTLDNNPFGEEGTIYLARSIQFLPMLRELSLNNIGAEGNGSIEIARSIEHLTSLQVLRLDHNRMTNRAICRLANSLYEKKELRELSLYGVYKNDKHYTYDDSYSALQGVEEPNGFVQLVNSIKGLFLQTLVLSNNDIDDNGVVAIADSFEGMGYPLTSLGLAHITIGEKGGAAIARNLRYLTGLKNLNLMGTKDLDERHPHGIFQIAQNLGVLSSLEEIVFSESELDDRGLTAIADGLTPESKIKRIYIMHTRVTLEGINYLTDRIIELHLRISLFCTPAFYRSEAGERYRQYIRNY